MQFLFALFITLHIAGINPFQGFKWYYISALLLLDGIITLLCNLWHAYGLKNVIRSEIQMMRYERIKKREVEKYKNELKNK